MRTISIFTPGGFVRDCDQRLSECITTQVNGGTVMALIVRTNHWEDSLPSVHTYWLCNTNQNFLLCPGFFIIKIFISTAFS